MQNITELRNSLIQNYELMKAKKISLKLGRELASTAGKILNSVRVELKYCEMTGQKPEIDFLDNKPQNNDFPQ